MRWGLVACAALLSGCVVDVDNSGVTFACGESELCPDGKECIDGLCQVASGTIDAAPVDAPVSSIDAGPVADSSPSDAAVVSDAFVLPANWWNVDFTRRRRLSFDNSEQNEELVDFPVLVVVDNTRIDFANTQDLGQDLRFVDSTGAVLSYEIERWNEANKSFVWVRIPKLSASSNSDYIWMYYGNTGAAAAQSPESVWTSGYRGVWHMQQSPAIGTPDSTAYDNAGTSVGEMGAANLVIGKIGQAIHFDGVNDWIQVPHSDSLNLTGDQVTVSAWVRMAAAQPANAGVVVKAQQAALEDNYYLGVQSTERPTVRVHTTISGRRLTIHDSALNNEQWHYLVGVYDGAEVTLYRDTVAKQIFAEGNIVPTAEDLLIGRAALDETGLFVGRIDEARVSAVARSQNWITAQYLSATDAFVTFGSEERSVP